MEIKYEKLTLSLNDDGSYTVTACEKDATNVVVPSEVDGIAVTEIGESAFEDCEKLVSITFNDDFELFLRGKTIKQIGAGAFSGCTSLLKIEIPCAVGIISSRTFSNCVSLTEVEYYGDDSLGYIGMDAFNNCRSLVKVPPANNIGEGAFSDCSSLVVPPIGEYIDEIGESAFARCVSLTEIKMPSTLTLIESLAFRGCRNLKRVEFENTEGWCVDLDYGFGSEDIDVSDPEKNAVSLAGVDYDDGVRSWHVR
ncbi:MAG: leucine-rich repeat domain-containing protein [Clostridia bacterium]|nr:leucine-rich repeat domain-containing protein [Clostridia bacterium]